MAGNFRFGPPRLSNLGGSSLPGAQGHTNVTWFLLGVIVLVWLIIGVAGGSTNPRVLLTFGAMYAPFIANGDYWRLFTAMFLHIGILHLVVNSVGLLIFGRQVEQIYGSVRFTIIYVLAGLSGSVVSFLLSGIAVGAGASGAIFGVLAALAAFLVARRNVLGDYGRQSLTGLLMLVAFNLVFGFIQPGIDNWAHMGGFVGGFALGYVFAPKFQLQEFVGPFGEYQSQLSDRNPLSRTWWIIPVVALALVGGVLLGSATVADNPTSRTRDAQRLFDQGRFSEAIPAVEEALALDPRHAEAYLLRGKILAQLGENLRAIANLTGALRLGGLNSRQAREARDLLDHLRGG